jgi:hypothetical protein
MALSDDQRPGHLTLNARAAIVNRTHRVVRERAQAIQQRKRTIRDLIVPVAICSLGLLFIASAVLSLGDESLLEIEGGLWHRILELGADAGGSISILVVWFLPISIISAAVVLLRRSRSSNRDDEVSR